MLSAIRSNPLNPESAYIELTETGFTDVCVRLYRITPSVATIQSLQYCITQEENAKAERFLRKDDQHRFLLTRAYTRIFLAEKLNQPPADIMISKNDFGKPILSNSTLDFSISHSVNYLLIAIAEHGHVGCDIETVENPSFWDISDTVESIASSKEREVLMGLKGKKKLKYAWDVWVKKEAWLKAIGKGFSVDPKHYCTETQVHKSESTHLDFITPVSLRASMNMALCHIEL